MDGSFPPAPFGVLPGFSYPANRSDRCGPMNPGLHSPPTPLPHSLAAGRMMGSGGPEDAGGTLLPFLLLLLSVSCKNICPPIEGEGPVLYPQLLEPRGTGATLSMQISRSGAISSLVI